MNSKIYKLPNGKKAVFEYDITGVGKITLECMDELMAMIADRPQGEWILECDGEDECDDLYRCPFCGTEYGCAKYDKPNYCPNCGADMREREGE